MTTRSGKKYKKDEMTDEGTTTGGVGLAEMMKLFMEDRKRREDDLAQERRRRDEEVREQMRLLREMVESSQRRAEAPARSSGENDKVKLSKFSEADDVEAYAAMATEDASDYDKVKAAILKRYNINDETYRQRFRAATKTGDESHRELLVRL